MDGWRVSTVKFWSLGFFEPDQDAFNDTYVLSRDFRRWVRGRTSSLKNVQVRPPWHVHSIASDIQTRSRSSYYHPPIDARWHHDGMRKNEYMTVWSNTVATEISRMDLPEIVYRPAPFEVVLFDNEWFRHRRPPIRSLKVANNRWFIRSPISSRALVRDVPGVYQYVT